MATATGSNAGHHPAPVTEDRAFYHLLWWCGVAIIATMLLSAEMNWNSVIVEKFGLAFNSGPTMMLVILAFVWLSLEEVAAEEVAAAYSYGKALMELSSGLHFLPFGLMQIRKGPRPVQEFQCPGEPEEIFKGDDKDELPAGMVRAIRVVTGATKGQGDILDTRMTLTLSFFVQWAITDVLNYTSNYGSSAKIVRQVRDIGEAILAEVATKHTPATFIAALPRINRRLVAEISARFENSGVRIISTRLVSPDISHAVSTALANIPKARAEAERAVIRGEANKTVKIKRGEGTASAELSLLKARAEGRKKMKDDLGVKGSEVLASEAVRGVLAQTDVLVMGGGGMRDAMGLVKAAQSAFNSSAKEKGARP